MRRGKRVKSVWQIQEAILSHFLSVNPVDGETNAVYPASSPQGVELAISRCRTAQESWAVTPVSERLAQISELKSLIGSHLTELQEALCLETGKTPQDALGGDLLPLIDAITFLERAVPRHLRPKILREHRNIRLHPRPIGVVAVIGTWNYPYLTDVTSILWALAAGCTVVWKPSELSTGSVLALYRHFQTADLPVYLVTGDASTAISLCSSGPDKVAFTGSVKSGRNVLAQLAKSGTPAVMELGGNDALIVLRDADVVAAARSAVWARVANAGQTCVAPQRIFVATAVLPDFVRECSLVISQLKRDRDYGPMRSAQLRDRVHSLVQSAVNSGATLVAGGQCPGGSGFYYPPTLLTGCSPDMDIIRQDVFGPVLAIVDFADEDEIPAKVNATEYGLAVSIWSRDVKRAHRIASSVQAGAISVNRETQFLVAQPAVAFGGTRASGFGSVRGLAGLDEWVKWQPVAVANQRTATRHLMPYRPQSVQILQAIALWKCAKGITQKLRALTMLGEALREWQRAAGRITHSPDNPHSLNSSSSPEL